MAMREVAPGMLAWSVMESPWSPTGYQTARTRAAAREVHVVRPPPGPLRSRPAASCPPGAARPTSVASTSWGWRRPWGRSSSAWPWRRAVPAGAFLAAGAVLAADLRVAGFRAGFLTDGSAGVAAAGSRLWGCGRGLGLGLRGCGGHDRRRGHRDRTGGRLHGGRRRCGRRGLGGLRRGRRVASAAIVASAGAASPRSAAISASLARTSADVARSRSMAWARSG